MDGTISLVKKDVSERGKTGKNHKKKDDFFKENAFILWTGHHNHQMQSIYEIKTYFSYLS